VTGRPCRETAGATRGGRHCLLVCLASPQRPRSLPSSADDQPEEQRMLLHTASGFVLSFPPSIFSCGNRGPLLSQVSHLDPCFFPVSLSIKRLRLLPSWVLQICRGWCVWYGFGHAIQSVLSPSFQNSALPSLIRGGSPFFVPF